MSAALKQQSDFVIETGQGIQLWQEETQAEVDKVHQQMTGCATQVEALETTVKEFIGPQQQKWQTAVVQDVEKRLREWEVHVDAKIGRWTKSVTKGCKTLEDKVAASQGDLREALKVVEKRQANLQYSVDAALQRLTYLETPIMRSI